MDSRLLLVKAITLAYRESQLSARAVDNSVALIKDVLSTIKTPEIIIDGDYTREIITNLKTTLFWMLEHPLEETIDKVGLLQQIRVNVNTEESLYEAIAQGIEETFVDETEIRKSCTGYRTELHNHLKRLRVGEILKVAYTRANFQGDSVDWRHFVKEVVVQLEPYMDMIVGAANPSVVNDFDFSNLDTIRTAMEKAQSELSNDGVMRFGTQAINRMFGPAGGVRRGEFCQINALQHNFKSGMALTLMKQLMLYNTPMMRDPSKKPMIMRISLENSATDDVYWLYKSLIENETGTEVNIKKVSYEEAIYVVADRLQKTGFTLNICRIDPSEFTYHDLFDRINQFEAQGFEIHALFIDYLNMMSKKGCTQGAQGQDTRDLFRRTRNFMNKKGIACFTPHQLSTQAKELIRMGAENFVQEIANKGYYDSCKTIDQEIDWECYIHIVKYNGESYLTMQRGKHRTPLLTPNHDLYTVLKFDSIGAIKDDINDNDSSRRTIGGATMAEGGGATWWG